MRRLLRHTGLTGVLSALLVVGLLHVSPAGSSLLAPFQSGGTSDSAPPFPSQDHGSGPRLAIPLAAAVPSAQSEQLESAPDGTSTSKGYLSGIYQAVTTGTQSLRAKRLAGHTPPISRMHLFCVYRL